MISKLKLDINYNVFYFKKYPMSILYDNASFVILLRYGWVIYWAIHVYELFQINKKKNLKFTCKAILDYF